MFLLCILFFGLALVGAFQNTHAILAGGEFALPADKSLQPS